MPGQDQSLVVHVFRVDEGLGNACLLQFPDRTCAILDWGTQQTRPLEAALRLAAKTRLRFVAASHAHADHVLGLPNLLRECSRRRIVVDRFVYPASTLNQETAYLTAARRMALERKIPMSSVGVDTLLAPPDQRRPPYLAWADDGSWEVRVLSPSLTKTAIAEMRALKQAVVAGNETSLVVLFRFVEQPDKEGSGRALFPGDATPATLSFARATGANAPGLEIDNQMFVVPHHGSSRNLPAWTRQHMHGIVVVSATTNSPHHPSETVLTQIAKWTGGEQLVCTSYAQCCGRQFGQFASAPDQQWVQPGECFGDIVIRVPRCGPAAFVKSSAPGHHRRAFGFCGNV
jgi:beta-lactamase superfamily II metal-dependent hydrolase